MLELVHPDAAGTDIGKAAHYAAVPAGRDNTPMRQFECFTQDLYALADWLQQCRIRTVAMSLPACMGYRYTKFWCNEGSRSFWSMRVTPRTYHAGRSG